MFWLVKLLIRILRKYWNESFCVVGWWVVETVWLIYLTNEVLRCLSFIHLSFCVSACSHLSSWKQPCADMCITVLSSQLTFSVIVFMLFAICFSCALSLQSWDHLVECYTVWTWVVADKWEGSGDCERIYAETDGRPQGGDWTDLLHLPRGISQSANKGMSVSLVPGYMMPVLSLVLLILSTSNVYLDDTVFLLLMQK